MKLHTARSSVTLYHRWMALLLVAIMILSVLPLSALTVSAEENDGTMPPSTETFPPEPADEQNEPPEGSTDPTDALEVVTSPTNKLGAINPRASDGQDGLAFNKTVTDQGDGTYKLELTLAGNPGEKQTPSLLDLVFIIDRSKSMEYGATKSEPRDRLEKAQAAANNLIDIISANTAINARFRIMDFSGSGHSKADDDAITAAHSSYRVVRTSNWYTSASDAKTRINGIKSYPRNLYEGGNYVDSFGAPIYGTKFNGNYFYYNLRATNYEAAFQTFNGLGGYRDGAMKVVIFMTDGSPTVTWSKVGTKGAYYDKAEHPDKKGYLNSEGYGTTFDYPENVAMCLPKTKDEMQAMTADRFYAIGFGDVPLDTLETLVGYVKSTNVPYKKALLAKNNSELTQYMKNIGYEIEKLFYTKITITDTLSSDTSGLQLVDIPEGAKLTITVTGNGNTYTSDTGSLSLPKTNTNAAATLTVTRSGDQIKLNFPATYKLESGLTYKLSTTIVPTEAAYRLFRANGQVYKDEPGPNTGTYANTTGIYSNKEAIANYTYNGTSGYKLIYPHPVIQLPTGKLVINKTITGWDTMTDAEKAEVMKTSFTVNLTYPDDGNGKDDEKQTVSFTLAQMTDNGDGTFTYDKITGLSPNTTYTVTESGGTVDGYKMATTVNGETANADKSATGTVAKGATVTVAYQNSYEIAITNVRIEKQVTGNMGSWEKDFTFTASLSGSANSLNGLTYIKYSKNENGELTAGTSTAITGDSLAFTLRDNEYIIIYRVPLDATLTVTENRDGYLLLSVVADGTELEKSVGDFTASASLALTVPKLGTEVGHAITFNNDKTVTIETGIVLDSLPYVLVLVGVAAAAMFLFLRKPRNFED